jgi:hypothetical protein
MYMEDLGKGMLFVSDIIFKMITINEEWLSIMSVFMYCKSKVFWLYV